ncbi:MAG TPA: hypothetical protein PKY25_02010 [Bacilli bacterium]|nr:hypothetical protein [Bacilli bacterium]
MEKVKLLFKKYWWVLLIVIIIIIVSYIIISIYIDKKIEDKKEQDKIVFERRRQEEEKRRKLAELYPEMSKKEIEKANNAFNNGIFIDDPEHDFVKMPEGLQGDGKPDNQNPEKLPYTDLKKVYIGADNKYVYVKYEFYGNFPKDIYEFGNNDFLYSIGVNLNLTQYYNHNLNKEDKSALMQLTISYASKKKNQSKITEDSTFFDLPHVATSTFGEANSLVKDENGEDTYGIGTNAGKTYGGVNTNYIMAEFPLSNLGLKHGDTIIFDIAAESSSRVYHHQSNDALLDYGSSKTGEYITWIIGSNSYTSKIPRY